ncbi:hypothetical protein LSAT2_011421 [Lamellibrachia satsuma]|nr:hypothetical protein LSAT2_011421 [Lamellibrachia satsuma]
MGAVSATPVNVHLFSAVVNFSYVDPATRTVRLKAGDIGRFGLSSRVEPEHGVVVHVRSGDGLHHGCRPPVNVPRGVRKWIALIRRGDCKFDEKIYNAAVMANASAVVVYNQKDEETLITMNHFVDGVVSVFIHKAQGEKIASLVDNGITVTMDISVGQELSLYNNETVASGQGMRLSALGFASLTMVMVLTCGLGVLLVYAIRRARYLRTKPSMNVVFTLPDRQLQQQEGLLASDIHDSGYCH